MPEMRFQKMQTIEDLLIVNGGSGQASHRQLQQKFNQKSTARIPHMQYNRQFQSDFASANQKNTNLFSNYVGVVRQEPISPECKAKKRNLKGKEKVMAVVQKAIETAKMQQKAKIQSSDQKAKNSNRAKKS